jgi:hypothetical protein
MNNIYSYMKKILKILYIHLKNYFHVIPNNNNIIPKLTKNICIGRQNSLSSIRK